MPSDIHNQVGEEVIFLAFVFLNVIVALKAFVFERGEDPRFAEGRLPYRS